MVLRAGDTLMGDIEDLLPALSPRRE